jgi:hypothetical protein
MLGTSEQMVNGFRIAKTQELAAIDKLVDRRREKDPQATVTDLETERADNESALRSLTTAHRILWTAKTLFPKTDETIDLVQRWMVDAANLGPAAEDDADEAPKPASRRRRGPGGNFGTVRARESTVVAAIADDQRSRGVPWIVGTSALFEVVVLALGCRIFSRRDF